MLNQPASDTQITHYQRLWLYLFCALVLIFLIAPILVVIPMSFSASRYLEFPPTNWGVRWYESYFASTEWMNATKVSLTVALLTMLMATPLGTAAAYALHRSRSIWLGVLRKGLMAPMMIPVIFVGVGAFFLFAKFSLNSTILELALTHTALAIPFVLITVSAGLKNYDMNQEKAARSLGAPPLYAFLTITLPQIKFSVASGALLSFIVSLDEVVVALFLTRGDSSTLTRRMFTALRDEIDPTIASISTLLILFSTSLLLLSQLLNKEKE